MDPSTNHTDHEMTNATEPKRVILRLLVSDFDGEKYNWQQHSDAIRVYLQWAGRSASEYEGDFDTRRHFAHVEPFQALEVKPRTFYIVLDIEQRRTVQDFNTLPHELYRVRRDKEGNLQLLPFQNSAEAANLITKIRTFTDLV